MELRKRQKCRGCRALEVKPGAFGATCVLGFRVTPHSNLFNAKPLELCPRPITLSALVQCQAKPPEGEQ